MVRRGRVVQSLKLSRPSVNYNHISFHQYMLISIVIQRRGLRDARGNFSVHGISCGVAKSEVLD